MRIIALVVGAALLSACGKGASPAAEPGRASLTLSASPGGSWAGYIPATPAAKVAVTPSAHSTPSQGSAAKPVTAALSLRCARAGVDKQTLTVTHARPNGIVGYSTTYSDGSNELTNRTYKAGYGYGKVHGDGTFIATWTVPAAALAGRATVGVLTGGSSDDPKFNLSFVVAPATGGC